MKRARVDHDTCSGSLIFLASRATHGHVSNGYRPPGQLNSRWRRSRWITAVHGTTNGPCFFCFSLALSRFCCSSVSPRPVSSCSPAPKTLFCRETGLALAQASNPAMDGPV